MKEFEFFEDCSYKEKILRWKNVLRVLNGLTPHERKKHWDMSCWGYKTDCGTIACAAGFCGMDKWFNRQGFKIIPGSESDNPDNDDYSEILPRFPTFVDELHDEDAVIKFFGAAGTENIFHNDKKRSVAKVIKEVKNYIEYLKLKEKFDDTKFKDFSYYE